jgi:hypothetical protein
MLYYWLDDLGFGVRFPARTDFSLFHYVQTGSAVHLTSYTVVPGLKRQGREADDSPPSSAEVKNCGAILPLPHTPSWRGA